MNSRIYQNKKPLFFFLVPAFLFMVVFLFYPFVQNIFNSFLQITGMGEPAKGVLDPWYANYATMFQDPNMLTALKNTLIVMVCTVIFQVGIALVLAILVDNIRAGAQFFRTVYFFPIVISATALGLLFNLIFLYNGGMVNQLVAALGHGKIDWKSGGLQLVTMLLPVMWQYVGFYFVILVTGLNNIDPELYEAAEIDGASRMQRITHVTLPLLKPVIATCVVLAVTGALKVFDLPWVMFPNGMPENTTWLTGTYMYFQTTVAGDVDYGSAIAVLIVVLGICVSLVINKLTAEKE